MLVGFFITLFGGLPIGFALALAALIFIWVGRHAARRHLRAADGARHRQFRAAGDPLLHPWSAI